MDKYSRHSNYKTSLIKPSILNLTKEEVPKHYGSLWNLGSKSFTYKQKPTLYGHNNINGICALDMERNHKENEAETLRQNSSNILQKNFNLKIRSKLEKRWKRALKELHKIDTIRVHKVDKGCGFAIVTHDTIKEKIKEQLGKATKTKREPTSRLTNKIQKKHFKLRRENKFKNKKKKFLCEPLYTQ